MDPLPPYPSRAQVVGYIALWLATLALYIYL